MTSNCMHGFLMPHTAHFSKAPVELQARERELLAEARQQLSAAEARLEAERSSQATQQQQFSYREQVILQAVH